MLRYKIAALLSQRARGSQHYPKIRLSFIEMHRVKSITKELLICRCDLQQGFIPRQRIVMFSS